MANFQKMLFLLFKVFKYFETSSSLCHFHNSRLLEPNFYSSCNFTVFHLRLNINTALSRTTDKIPLNINIFVSLWLRSSINTILKSDWRNSVCRWSAKSAGNCNRKLRQKKVDFCIKWKYLQRICRSSAPKLLPLFPI